MPGPSTLKQAAIVAAYRAGDPVDVIATRYGVTGAEVRRVVLAADPDRGPVAPVSRRERADLDAAVRDEERAQVRAAAVADYLAGESPRDVAARYQVTPATVLRWVRAAGEEVRPRPEHPHRDDAVRDYLAGESSTDVAARYGVTPDTVLRWVRADGHQVRPRPEHPHRDDAVRDYLAGESLRVIADRYGVDKSTVRDWMTDAGVPLRTGADAQTGPAPVDDVLSDCEAGDSGPVVAARYGISETTVRKHRTRAGIPARTVGADPDTKADAVAAYLAGATLREVADQYGVAQSTVVNWIRAAGHEPRGTTTRSGTRAPHAHDPDLKKAAVAEYLAGESAATVAARHGMSEATVLTAVRASGHKPRRRGNPGGPSIPATQ